MTTSAQTTIINSHEILAIQNLLSHGNWEANFSVANFTIQISVADQFSNWSQTKSAQGDGDGFCLTNNVNFASDGFGFLT